MTPRIFIGWSVATLAAVAAAIAVTLSQPELARVQTSNDPAFPALRERPEDVAHIELRSAAGTVMLARDADGNWTAPDKFGHPAKREEVRKLVAALADMRLIEAKTRREDRLARLELEDVATEDAKSRLVRLTAADGAVLAEAVIGKASDQFTGEKAGGVYMRRPDEQQAWLASGDPQVPTGTNDWLESRVVHLSSDSVGWVEVSPAAGKAYAASRNAKDALWQVSPAEDGRKLKESALSRLAAGLGYIDFADVAPKGDVAWPESGDAARLRSFDGVEVTVHLRKIDGKSWGIFEAAYVGPEGDESEAAQAARRQVEDINARTKRWAYRLEDYVAERLTIPYADLFEDSDKSS